MPLSDKIILAMANKGFKSVGLSPQGIAFEGMGNGKQVTVPIPKESPRPDDEDRVCEQLVTGAIAKIEAGQ